MQEIAINVCHGGFGLSDAAYEKLIEYGIPVQPHYEEKYDDGIGLYLPNPRNDGEVIFDRDISTDTTPATSVVASRREFIGRYWNTWIRYSGRDHPLVIRAIKELGEAANDGCARLKIVEIPDDVQWEIVEYEGFEHVAEKHRTWA